MKNHIVGIILACAALVSTACQKNSQTTRVTAVSLLKVEPSTSVSGEIVKVSGSNFSTKKDGNTVTVGGKTALVLEYSKWEISFVVPELGAGVYEVVVSNENGSSSPLKILLDDSRDVVYAVSVFAGSGDNGRVDGTGTEAQIGTPEGICWDSDGSILVTQRKNGSFCVRRITSEAVVTTVSLSTLFNTPWGICVGPDGKRYVANKGNNNLVVWSEGSSEQVLDLGVELNNPMKVTFAPDGAMIVANRDDDKVLRFEDGVLTATYNVPKASCVTTDAAGNIYAGSETTAYLYRIDAATGNVTTIAGNGRKPSDSNPYSDGSPGDPSKATIGTVGGIFMGANKVLYFTDKTGNSVRKLSPGIDDNYSAGTLKTMTDSFYPNDIIANQDCTAFYVTSSSTHTVRLIEIN